MGFSNDEQELIAELSHQINSPLAAIRNALYLAASQTDDPALLRYLNIADEEVTTIVAVLQANRAVIEQTSRPPSDVSGSLFAPRRGLAVWAT